jgi:hypothetical protein
VRELPLWHPGSISPWTGTCRRTQAKSEPAEAQRETSTTQTESEQSNCSFSFSFLKESEQGNVQQQQATIPNVQTERKA